MNNWIYETPDGGKTLFRRTISTDVREMRFMIDKKEKWLSISELRHIGKNHLKEEQLREQYPMLMELWNQYQTLFKLLEDKKYDNTQS